MESAYVKRDYAKQSADEMFVGAGFSPRSASFAG